MIRLVDMISGEERAKCGSGIGDAGDRKWGERADLEEEDAGLLSGCAEFGVCEWHGCSLPPHLSAPLL